MTETDRFSLQPASDGRAQVADLLLDGRALGVKVRGAELARQYAVTATGGYLLLITETNHATTTLHAYLLDRRGRLVQRKTIGGQSPARLLDVRARSAEKLTFVFADRAWGLLVHPKPNGIWGLLRPARLELNERPDTRAVDRALDEFGRTREVVPMGGHVLRADQAETIVRVMYMTDHIPPARAWFAVPANGGPVRELSYADVAPFERVWR